MKAGWEQVPLGRYVDIIMGQAPSSKECNFDGRGTPFVKVGEFSDLRPITREWTTNPLKLARRSDVLICVVGATCGKLNLGEDCAIGRSVAAIRPRPENLNQIFLYYFLTTLVESLRSGSLGAAQTVISKEMISQIPVPIPPLSEQAHIVGILDEAFASIATAKANTQKSLENAKAVFESHLNSVFSYYWGNSKIISINNLCEFITDGDHMPPPKAAAGVPFITIGNINKTSHEISFDDTFMVPQDYYKSLAYNKKPQIGDVLYTVTGSFGIPAIVTEDREFCFQRHIGLLRPKCNVASRWLYYLLQSPQVSEQAILGATGTAQKTVSLRVLRGFQVVDVPHDSQCAAISLLDRISEETSRLTSLYTQKLSALEDLKKSLLHQAFTGKL